MVTINYEDHGDGRSSLEISIVRVEDGATTSTKWDRKPTELVMRNAYSNLNEFKNNLNQQNESYKDLEMRIPKMQEAMERIKATVVPNLESAVDQLESIVPEDYDPVKSA